MFPTDVVIVAGARTPMARYTGAFSDVSAIDLAAHASQDAIRRWGVDAGEFHHAIFGNVMQTGEDGIYGARLVGLKAELEEIRHHAPGRGCVRSSQPASGRRGLPGMPHEGRAGPRGGEAREEINHRDTQRTPR